MAMVISHNIPALTTYNTINRTNSALEKSIQKLSTGLRINSAADDAAGLAISEKMRSQINGMDRAVSNAQDGISMIQVAEGALNETHSILQRMRELSVQAANDTLTSQDRGYIQMEIDQLREEVTRIGNTTQFNKKKLLNGDAAVLWSSSDLNTKAIINGGMRSIDQFGQKVVTEGNYNISIKANPGTGQVQKSDIFKIKHENVMMNAQWDPQTGVDGIKKINDLPAGEYTVKGAAAAESAKTLTGQYGFPNQMAKATGDITESTDTAVLSSGKLVATVNGTELASVSATGDGTSVKALQEALVKKLQGDEAQKKAAEMGFQIKATNWTAGTGSTLTVTTFDGSKTPELKIEGKDLKNNSTPTPGDVTVAAVTIAAAEPAELKLDTACGFAIDKKENLIGNASVLFEVTDVNDAAETITLKASATILDANGINSTTSTENIVLKKGQEVHVNEELLGKEVAKFNVGADYFDAFKKGQKFVYNISNGTDAQSKSDVTVKVSGSQNDKWDRNWTSKNSGVTDAEVSYGLTAANVAGKEVDFKNYYLNEKTGESQIGSITLSFNNNFNATNAADKAMASFEAAYVGQVAKGDVKLRDLDKFWTSEGVFMLDDPKTITLTQGDGKEASVTLYATDTLDDVRDKLNSAIASGLGQGQYVDDASKFVSFVEKAGVNSESVPGTFLIRTVVPGEQGRVVFSGDENVINAFSLNTIQNASESKYTVTVKDAHDGTEIASEVQVTGNKLVGVIHPNVDVEFDSLAGVSAKWDASKNAFTYQAETTNTTLHLSDNTTVFQIGANEGEDMGVHIGDMRATALGLDRVNVTNRESASRSITILDNAIDKVSTQRAKLGAYQNRLEHTVNNLNTASENITAAESRIRDTDMAKEMMNFTKLQIMLQAGTSMLAQANQLPQNVMALVR